MNEKLSYFRKKKKLTQQEVAAKLGIAVSTYSMIESGQRGISLDKAYALAKLYGITIEELFFKN